MKRHISFLFAIGFISNSLAIISDEEVKYLGKLKDEKSKVLSYCKKVKIENLLSFTLFTEDLLSDLKGIVSEQGEEALLMVTEKSYSILHAVIQRERSIEALKFLLSFEKVRKLFVNCPCFMSGTERTPLFYAMRAKNLESMKLLVVNGALVCMDALKRAIDSTDIFEAYSNKSKEKRKILLKKTFDEFKCWYEKDYIDKGVFKSKILVNKVHSDIVIFLNDE